MLDFALGMMVFLLVLVFVSGQFDVKLGEAREDGLVWDMEARAGFALGTLLRSPGSPSGWEGLGIESVDYPGLADTDRRLSQAKVAALGAADYNRIKEKMGLGDYGFFFSFGDDVNAGVAPDANAALVVVERVATYDGETIGAARLSVYRPRG